ncbi:MAG: ATP-binding cassette domain-containing protein, partial [Phycisphaerales bacterium]|nr:ATP-binding cassette domain-containing protein [Phycisphaerales bacterium]
MSDAETSVKPETSSTSRSRKVLLEVKDLKMHFPIRSGILQLTTGHVKAVDGVSFEVREGETLGLVGESGCGKTTVGRSLLRLIPATSGSVRFDGIDVLKAGSTQLRELRRQMQIIFQDPAG